MKHMIWIALVLIPCCLQAQSWKSKPFSVSVFNNATLLPPASITAAFNQPLHPGIAVSYEFGWLETIKSPIFQNTNTFNLGGREVYTGKWFQNIGLSWFYHRYVNHAFTLTTQAGYRKYLKKFSAEASLHMGYMHAQLFTEKFVRRDGMWIAGYDPFRGYFIAGAGVGVGYDAGYRYNIRRFFINYDFRLQMPFVKSYVPVLPNGILSVGMQFTLFKKPDGHHAPTPTQLPCPES
ncbi:MAG: hypothetical protein WCQ70_07135 [Lentimicrobiaceae bacterium]